VTFQDKVRLLSDLYRAFNRRELDRVLAALSPSVRWPNALERTELRGHAAIRSYWLEQFETIEPRVEPVEFEERPEASVIHTYAFDEGLVASMVVS
jgi:SnoaL-like domain